MMCTPNSKQDKTVEAILTFKTLSVENTNFLCNNLLLMIAVVVK